MDEKSNNMQWRRNTPRYNTDVKQYEFCTDSELNKVTKIYNTIIDKFNDENLPLIDTKKRLIELNDVINSLKHCLTRMQSTHTSMTSKFSDKLLHRGNELKKIENHFDIKNNNTIKTINVPLAIGIEFACKLYKNVSSIPIMQYAAIMKNHKPLIIFKYNKSSYVSCTPFTVINNTEPHRTLCCINNPCKNGNDCQFFHDPCIYSDSTHIQQFFKTSMIKTCPYFGDYQLLHNQITGMSFDQLRTIARYCASMNLSIHIAMNQ